MSDEKPKVYFRGEWLTIEEVRGRLGRRSVNIRGLEILKKLVEKGEPTTIKSLSEELHIPFKNVYIAVNFLERKGYVVKIGKYRGMLVGITPMGYRQVQKSGEGSR